MSTWRGAFFFAKEELKKVRWKHLLTLFFIGYMVMFMMPMFTDAIKGENGEAFNWAIDFITLSVLPTLGFMSTQSMGFYWKTDVFTKKLVVWRTMPIPVKQIALGRFLIFITILLPALILYFILFYVILKFTIDEISLLPFILFAIFWIGYAITIGLIYLFFELTQSGKVYFWFCMLLVIGYLAIMVAYTFTTKQSVVIMSYNTFIQGNWWIALISVLISVLVTLIMIPKITKKLKTRSYIS
ncbi:hypothetical protein I6N90_20545 [Paenibacillus sp. GSMTC-2017]|uniref:hypothetical protein n=1 Tax=Paenibacillus sp. GSMTC-2017 TaxID=2794350 RepID=UPI0018D954CD|nr:hypothetical protein [Paenibacillus sp. GSMTC-2017]MBH5320199.1 hypothetical protein [Paenibacillus sp. GSMTC-2017]